jgi:hypothetical protein
LYAFCQGRKSADALIEEKADPLFDRATTLGVGEFVYKDSNLTPAELRKFTP